MALIGYMPYLKPGSTLLSAVVIHRRMFHSASAGGSLATSNGRQRRPGNLDVFGAGAGYSARSLFGASITVRQVLEQHTLFGVYSRSMPAAIANTLASQLAKGDSSHFRVAFRGHRRRRIPRLATNCLRSCEKCMQEDMDRQGFTSWRVLHLLPSIGHCPEHGETLCDEGEGNAEGARVWSFALPGEQNSRRTNVKAMSLPVSDGYASYLQLWTETFNGDLTGIVPDLWMLVMDAVVRQFGTITYACEKISAAIRRLWGVSLGEIASALDIADGELFVRAELEQRVQASYVASRLVIVGALDELNMSPPRRQPSPDHVPLTLSDASPFGSWLSPPVQAELRQCVIDANFPPALFRALAEDVNVYTIDANVHIDRLMVKKFATTLPDELLETMSKEQSWSNDSWLMKEIRRREDAWPRGEK